MAFREKLHDLMPTFFPAVKSAALKPTATGNALPMPKGGGRSFWWGDGTGPMFGGFGLSLGPQIDFTAAAGDPAQNSAVAACLNWLGTNWGAAPLQVGSEDGDGKFDPIPDHPLVAMLNQPHEDYTGKWLAWALVSDYYRSGNAYAHIVMGADGPAEVEYLPARCVTPVPDATGRIASYSYKPAQTAIPVPKEQIVHFRYGIDPDNVLSGVSPLNPVCDEITSDNSAARYVANLLHHGGLPPAILTPDPAGQANAEVLTPEIARMLKEAFNEKRRLNPGEIQLLTNALKLIELGWKPNEMALNDVREEPETRICAVFGIPPIAVGLRAGLIRSTYSNMEEANKQAWLACLAPLQSYFASEWTRRLLPLFPGGEGLHVRYDHSQVSVLSEDMNAKRSQARQDWGAGLLTHDEARAEGGRVPLEDGEKAGLKNSPPEPRGNDVRTAGDAGDGPDALKSYKSADVEWVTIHGRHVPIGADGKPNFDHPDAGKVSEKAPSASAKSMLAKQSATYVGKDIQQYAEEHNEPAFAKGVGGLSLRDNEPVDVIVLHQGVVAHGIELKTMVSNKAAKITMKADAMERKSKWMETNHAPFHTVVFDDHAVFNAGGAGKHDESKRQIYYKRGFGSFRVAGMHPVKDMAELKSLIGKADADLPRAAQPPSSYPGVKPRN